MQNRFSMQGKRVLVTGASSGFGAHFAVTLAEAGADLVLAARRLERLEQTAAAVRAFGREALVLPMDVADPASVEQAFTRMPALDVVINNAGISRLGTTESLSEDDWDAVLDTNLKGVWAVSRAAIKAWRAAGRPGNLVNVASVLALRVGNQLPAYAASKAAVVQFTRSVALDYARYNIRCNALCPGYFVTEINRDWLASEAGQRQISRVPFRRVGEMEDISGPLLLLASDASRFMSGVALPVDGGHLCSAL